MIYKIKLDGKVLYYPGDRQAAVINPELDLQTGYAGELTLKVPPLNPLYGEIHNRKSMVSVYRGNTEIFYGEVRTREKDRFKNQPVKATGALSFLADSILPQQEWHDISPRDLLDAWLQLHNNQVEDRKKIYTGVVTIHDSNDSLYRITDRENTLEAIRDKLVDRLGGYLRLRHENEKLYLDWLTIQEYGKYCEQPIQFGENLMDYSETMTADDVITALIPLGAAIEQETDENASEFERLEKNVDITSVNDGKDYIYSKEAVENFGWVWRTEKWDDVSVPANLLKKATEFLTSKQYESLVISLTAVDLSLFGQDYDSFDIGDRVLCNAIPYGMKKVLPVMEMKIPLQQPDQAQLTLGENLQQSFTDQTSGTFTQIRQEATDAGRVQTEWMKSAIDNLTKQMTGAKGGYKLTEFDENGLWLRDLYMDAPDKNQAIQIGNVTLSSVSNAFKIQSGVKIYCGTSSFSDGTDRFQIYNLQHVTSGGHMVFASDGATVAYLSSSSKRYKDHIADMTINEAKKILDVPVIWFKYKENYLSPTDWLNGKKLPGFYAEDVYSIFPEAAQLNEEGKPEDWNFRILIPLMLKLIQNLYEEKEKTANE